MTDLTDQTLLSYWYRNHNAEAFRVLSTRHAQMVYATALRILKNPAEAEDVAQESFLELARTKRPPTHNAGAWLHRTTYRKALSSIRSSNRRQVRDGVYARDRAESTTLEWDDLQEHVDWAVAALPTTFRDPIVLYFFEEQEQAEIAKSLGVSRQVVTYRVRKGIELIRTSLSSRGVKAPMGAALLNLIHENASGAAPASLMKSVGHVALGAKPSLLATAVSVSGSMLFQAAAIICLLGFAGLAAFEYTVQESVVTPDLQIPNAASTAIASSVPTIEEPPEEKISTIEEVAMVSSESAGPKDASASTSLDEADSATDNTNLASLSGVVEFPDGRPMIGANVTLLNTAYIDDGRYPAGTRFELKADSGGRFSQSDMTATDYSIQVSEADDNSWGAYYEVARITLEPGEKREDLKLVFGREGNFTVSGTVVDSAGAPLEGVRLYKFGPVPRASLTDASGRFTLHYLPEDRIQIHATKQRYSSRGAGAVPGDQNVRLVMYRDGAIEGRVVDAITREPITNFDASFMNGSAQKFREGLFGNKRSFENSDGTFNFPQVQVGEVTIVARTPGYAPMMVLGTVSEGVPLEDVLLELSQIESVALTGQVVNAEGLPIAGASVAIGNIPMPHSRESGAATTTDASGKFTILSSAPDVAFLSAWHEDFAPASGLVTDDMTITLKKAGHLNVEVYSQGKPLSRTRVHARYFAERHLGYSDGVVTDQNGRAVMKEIIPGKVNVGVDPVPNRTIYKTLYFEPGEEKTVRFDVVPSVAEVEVFVTKDGEPVTQARINLTVDTGSSFEYFEQNQSSDGAFQIRDVPLGEAQLMVMTDQLTERAFVDDVSLVSGQVTTVTVELTATRRILGTIANAPVSEGTFIMVLRGSMNMDEAIEISEDRAFFGSGVAGFGGADESGSYETTFVEAGLYTLLVFSFSENDYFNNTYYESRVVEVREGKDLVENFDLNY